MITITDKRNCCGCTACASICPKSAITMEADAEGFFYPKIDVLKCVNCDLCEKVCPITIPVVKNEFPPEGHIGRNKNLSVLNNSTSGGVVSAVLEYLFDDGFIAYGAIYNEEWEVVHSVARNTHEAEGFRGSKYVQSRLGETYQSIKTFLQAGQKVCFIGTPCQVAGLKKFLRIDYSGLFCMDFVCHGVPSPLVWGKYRDEMERKFMSVIQRVSFRQKTYGYHSSTMCIEFENGHVYTGSGRVDCMMKAFSTELCLRESCHHCAFKSEKHVSDLTLFDCKGYSKITGNKDDDAGYTSIIVQSEQGQSVLNSAACNLELKVGDLSSMIAADGIMVNHSIAPNKKRTEFFQLLKVHSLEESLNFVEPITRKDHIIEAAKGVLYKFGLIRIAQQMKRDSLKTQ